MRSTCGRVKWLLDSNEQVVGISLGGDATSEHEQGTKILAASFGYEYGAAAGVLARKLTKLPKGFGTEVISVDDVDCLLLSSALERAKGYLAAELRFNTFLTHRDGKPQDTVAAWDESNFAILSRGSDVALLRGLADSFESGDVMAGGLLTKLFPGTGGLMYAVASQVPGELLAETQLELDEVVARRAILETSGVKERLSTAGRKWFSLDSTAWTDETKTSIRVWLNPYDQHTYSHGWFSLEELEMWVTNEGPVVIKRTAKTA